MEVTDVKQAEPSAAAGAEKQFTQYDGWDEHGTPIVSKKPDSPKTEEPAASASSATETDSEPKGKSAADAETATSQEKDKKERKPGEKKSAEERIAELTAKVKTLEEERERSRSTKAPEPPSKEEPKTESAKQPATYAEWRKAFKPKEWVEQWAKDNPDASYEDAVSALADFQSDVRFQYQQVEQLKEAGVKRSQAMLRKTVEKYPDAEPKVKEAAKKIMQPEIPAVIRALVDDSDVMTDLLYTLSDEKTLANFLETAKTNPGKAVRVLRDMERDIEAAIEKPAAEKPGTKKTDKEDTPAEPKPRAPKPPSEVGGRGTGHEDPSVAAARSGDFRTFEAEQNRRLQARFKQA
jgi:hypothetical protein